MLSVFPLLADRARRNGCADRAVPRVSSVSSCASLTFDEHGVERGKLVCACRGSKPYSTRSALKSCIDSTPITTFEP